MENVQIDAIKNLLAEAGVTFHHNSGHKRLLEIAAENHIDISSVMGSQSDGVAADAEEAAVELEPVRALPDPSPEPSFSDDDEDFSADSHPVQPVAETEKAKAGHAPQFRTIEDFKAMTVDELHVLAQEFSVPILEGEKHEDMASRLYEFELAVGRKPEEAVRFRHVKPEVQHTKTGICQIEGHPEIVRLVGLGLRYEIDGDSIVFRCGSSIGAASLNENISAIVSAAGAICLS